MGALQYDQVFSLEAAHIVQDDGVGVCPKTAIGFSCYYIYKSFN